MILLNILYLLGCISDTQFNSLYTDVSTLCLYKFKFNKEFNKENTQIEECCEYTLTSV